MTRAVGNKNRLNGVTGPIPGQSADWTVLVVDDEPGILEIVQRVLRQANYTVIPSRDGDDALDLLERNQPSIDLVLTDIVMPGPIDGIVLANKIRQKYQNLSVLFMAGWLPERDEFATGMARDRRLLRKPFSPRELLEFIDSHLGRDEPDEKVRSRIDLESV